MRAYDVDHNGAVSGERVVISNVEGVPDGIKLDEKGNIYVTETYRGQRVQKFVYKGLAPVTKTDQGVVWPTKKKG